MDELKELKTLMRVISKAFAHLQDEMGRQNANRSEPDIARPSDSRPTKHVWRVGKSIGRTIYSIHGPEAADDKLIGMMDTSELAMRVVQDHNHSFGVHSASCPSDCRRG